MVFVRDMVKITVALMFPGWLLAIAFQIGTNADFFRGMA